MVASVCAQLFMRSYYVMTISPQHPNIGVYFWDVPDGLPHSDSYRVKVTSTVSLNMYGSTNLKLNSESSESE